MGEYEGLGVLLLIIAILIALSYIFNPAFMIPLTLGVGIGIWYVYKKYVK
jgi:hypothetical protein